MASDGSLRLCSQWLWLPAALGLVLSVFNETEYAGRESIWQAFYSLATVLWASAFLQHWTRTQAKLRHQWALASGRHGAVADPAADLTATADDAPAAERSRFAAASTECGFYTPNDDFVPLEAEAVPDGLPLPMVGVFGGAERSVRIAASWGVLAVCMALSICVQLGLLLGRSVLVLEVGEAWVGHLLGALFIALAVEALAALFHPLVEGLLAWQNHRSAAQHETHYAQQLFCVAFVNRFFSPLYLTLLKPLGHLHLFHAADAPDPVPEMCRTRDGGASDSCAEELATQVGALLVVSCLVQNAFEYAAASGTVRRLRALAGGRVTQEASMAAPGSAGSNFFELSMSYAMVALFAGAFLPAAAIALLNNALEARTDSLRFLRVQQRPHPQQTALVEAWWPILQLVSLLSIVTNVLLVCHAYADQTEPNPTRPNQPQPPTKPNQTKPDQSQTRPHQTKPDQTKAHTEPNPNQSPSAGTRRCPSSSTCRTSAASTRSRSSSSTRCSRSSSVSTSASRTCPPSSWPPSPSSASCCATRSSRRRRRPPPCG